MYTKLPDIFVFVYMTGVYIYLFLQRVFIFLFVSASVEGAKKILIVDEIKREKEIEENALTMRGCTGILMMYNKGNFAASSSALLKFDDAGWMEILPHVIIIYSFEI